MKKLATVIIFVLALVILIAPLIGCVSAEQKAAAVSAIQEHEANLAQGKPSPYTYIKPIGSGNPVAVVWEDTDGFEVGYKIWLNPHYGTLNGEQLAMHNLQEWAAKDTQRDSQIAAVRAEREKHESWDRQKVLYEESRRQEEEKRKSYGQSMSDLRNAMSGR